MAELVTVRFLVSVLYLIAGVSYVRLFLNRPLRGVSPTGFLIAALICHAIELAARGAEAGAAGGAPFAGRSGFMSLFSFLVGCVYLFMEKRYKIKPLGAFHAAVIFAVHILSAIFKSPMTTIPILNTGHLFVLHVAPAIFAYAALSVSLVAGVAFLLLERQLRQKKFGLLMQNLPNLELVETVNAAGVNIGLPLLAAGACAGTIMGYRHWGAQYQWDLKNWVTLGVILIYLTHVLLRRFAGYRGRRTVLISTAGHIAVIFSLTVVNTAFSSLHAFF